MEFLPPTGLPEEARPALLEALHALGRALTVEQRLPNPGALEEVLLPPLSVVWGDALPVLRQYQADTEADWRPVSDALARLQ